MNHFSSPQEEALEIAILTRRKILSESPEAYTIIRSCFVIAENLSKIEDLTWINGE